ncbi:Uncharacterised protein [Anaerotruncus sp. 2789STDY5834896]|uniref:Uncharacterized protein n=1 Tax=uncultured Anaerotruncus sp. TaxID=905011 RepID=A0A1C6FNN2_9FIRM|nr:Uncharacterised protein [uncultured Anaerotruncus sp.]
MSEFKQEFLQIYRTHIARTGADKLLAWLETTDFFYSTSLDAFSWLLSGRLVRTQCPCVSATAR